MASLCLSGQKYLGSILDPRFFLNPTPPTLQFYLQNTSQICPSLSILTASSLGQATVNTYLRVLNSLLTGLPASPLGLWHTASCVQIQSPLPEELGI